MKEIKVPVLPESITEATVAAWHKKPGDYVELDDAVSYTHLRAHET